MRENRERDHLRHGITIPRPHTKRMGAPSVEPLKRIPHNELVDLMGRSLGLVFPSIWLEGLVLVCSGMSSTFEHRRAHRERFRPGAR